MSDISFWGGFSLLSFYLPLIMFVSHPHSVTEKLQDDMAEEGDITMTSLQFSLLCPLSKARMRLPCRAVTCEHLQCFDAACYLMMNERKPKWVCPVCANPIEFENLQIDE